MHGQLSSGLSVSIVMDSTLTQRHVAFKVGAANVILVHYTHRDAGNNAQNFISRSSGFST